jgi:sugar-specific transcriptional regulator TrmB
LQEALGNLTLPAAIESLQTLTQVVDILTGKVEELRTEFRLWNAIINQVAGGLPEVGIGIGDVTNAIIESTKNLVPFVRTLELGYKFLRLMGQAQLPEDFGDMMDGGGFLPEDQPVDPTQQTLPPKPQAKPQGKVEEERMRRLQNRINAAQKYLQAEAKANAEIEKQGELLADALKSSQRAVELAEARLNGNEDEVRLQHEIADIQEKFKGNGADILIQDLKRVKALEDQKDAADALAKAEEERRKNDPGVQMQEQLDKLLDKQNQAAAAATAFGNAFSTAITSVINGTKSADQAIADMLSSVAEHFMDMAAQIIAKQLAIIAYGLIMKALGFGFNPSQDGISGLSIGSPSSFGGGNLFAADGAYVSSPTSAVVGEGGEPEYIIPESKMRESMSRYSRGARGGSVIPENGGGGSVMDGGGGTAVAAPIDVRYTVERINSVDYVTADQFQQGMQQAANQGAKQGEQQTLKRLQMSSSTRKRLGM